MDPKTWNTSTLLSDSDIEVLDDAKKHPTQFHDGVRKPTDADVRNAVRGGIRFALASLTQETDKVWKWEEWGDDLSCKPKPRRRKRNNICFKVVGAKIQVFHYHKGFYD